jgi:hypothetical protein
LFDSHSLKLAGPANDSTKILRSTNLLCLRPGEEEEEEEEEEDEEEEEEEDEEEASALVDFG